MEEKTNDNKNNKKTKSFILFLVLIILLIIVIFFIYKNTKLSRIQNELENKYMNIDNFSIEIINRYTVFADNEKEQEEEIKKYISYEDEMNVFSKGISQNELRAYVDKNEKMDAVWYYNTDTQSNVTNYLMYRPVEEIITIGNVIEDEINEFKSNKYTYTEENFDNKECIVFRSKTDKMMKEMYLEKETLLPVKTARYIKDLNSNEYIMDNERIFNIKINTVSKADILIPNKEAFSKVEFSDTVHLRANNDKTIPNLGDGMIEKFKILNTEDAKVEYFSSSNDENIKYAEIENYSTYERFTSKWGNIKKLKEEDFKNYKVYILVNTDITKDMEVKEKVVSYDSTVENYILNITGKDDTSYNTGILIVEPIKNYGEANFVELKNELVIKSDEETMNVISEQNELMLQYVKNYTKNQDLQILYANRGGWLENIVPTDFFETQGETNNTLEKEERTCWVEQIGFKTSDETKQVVLLIYIDAETKELIAAKIIESEL